MSAGERCAACDEPLEVCECEVVVLVCSCGAIRREGHTARCGRNGRTNMRVDCKPVRLRVVAWEATS